jgi:photosystem II stability/assembly factor-like uncharacterized protein
MRNARALLLLAALLIFGSVTMSHSYTVRRLTNNHVEDVNARINDHGHVVWERANAGIFLYNGSTVTRLTKEGHYAYNPQITNKDHVVWEEFRSNEYAEFLGDIMLYDGGRSRRITNNHYNDVSPQINNSGHIVWQGYKDDNWEIFLYDGTGIRQISNNSYENSYPQINDNGYVVWGRDLDILIYDGHDITSLAEELNRASDFGLQINNRGYVVWQSGASWHEDTTEMFLATPPGLAVVSPNGGEIFASGSVQTIRWITAKTGLSFDLLYSIDNKITWEPIANDITGISYNWTIPAPTGNSKECFVRVVAYRASSLKVEADVSDAPFSIESVTLMAPNHLGIYLIPGELYDITWETHETVRPVETVELYFTRDAMADPVVWEPIATFGVNEYPGVFPWQVPDVTRTKRQCKVKVVLKDAESKRVGMVVGDSYFTIQFLNTENEWIYVGLQGATITKLVFDPLQPNVLYAAGYGGSLFKTIDGGKTWESLNKGIENLRMQSLVIDPSNSGTLYVGDTMYKGIYKSTDYAQSWSPVSPLLEDFNPYIWDLVIDPLNTITLYAGGEGGVYKTTDGGASWNPMGQGRPSTHVVSLAMDPENPNILYAGTYRQNGLYKSTDGGENWRIANTGIEWYGDVPSVSALAINPSNSNVLYAGTGTYNQDDVLGLGVFKSTNGGENWIPVNTGLPYWGGGIFPRIYSLAIDPLRPSTVYCGTEYGRVFKTPDGGGHWRLMDKGLDHIWYIVSLAIDPWDHHTVYAATGFPGVFKIHQSHGHITVKPTSVEFGNVLEGGILKKTITVGNDGPRGLILGAISDPAGSFSITGSTCGSGKVLVSGATCKITVHFAPHTPGSFTSIFTIASDDPDNPTVTVILSGASGTVDTK